MMKFDVQSLVDRESAERGREFGEWAAACGRNRERMQEIGETAAGAAYQISVGGCGKAEMWLYVDSDEKCVRVIGDRERREYRRFAKEAADFFAGSRTSPDEMEAAVRDAREKAVAAREKSEALWRWREHLADLEAMSAGVAALFGRRPSENRMPPPAARPPGMMPLPQRKPVGDALEKSAQTRQRVAAWRVQVARLAGAAH